MLNNKIRIIGGRWRGRQLSFPDVTGLRPTPNRVRETLFNWLTLDIQGARCLDLFAGSGALGFEAASRGASQVVMIDQVLPVILQLQANKTLLQADDDDDIIIQQTVFSPQLNLSQKPFDIIFLDPPFKSNLIGEVCQWLVANDYLAHEALIYIETEIESAPLPIPVQWKTLKEKKAGQVAYYLIKA